MERIKNTDDYDALLAELGGLAIEMHGAYSSDIEDSICRVVRTSQYLMYNRYYGDILRFSDAPNRGLERGLVELNAAVGIAKIVREAAFWALYTDVTDWVYNDSGSEVLNNV